MTTKIILNTLHAYLSHCLADTHPPGKDTRAAALLNHMMQEKAVMAVLEIRQPSLQPPSIPTSPIPWLQDASSPTGICRDLDQEALLPIWLQLQRCLVLLAEHQVMIQTYQRQIQTQPVPVPLIHLLDELTHSQERLVQAISEGLDALTQRSALAIQTPIATASYRHWQVNHQQALEYHSFLKTHLNALTQELTTQRAHLQTIPTQPPGILLTAYLSDHVHHVQALMNQTRHELGLSPQSFDLHGKPTHQAPPKRTQQTRRLLPPKPKPTPKKRTHETQVHPTNLINLSQYLTGSPVNHLSAIGGHSIKSLQPLAHYCNQARQGDLADTQQIAQVLKNLVAAQTELESALLRHRTARDTYWIICPWHWSAIWKLNRWHQLFNRCQEQLISRKNQAETASKALNKLARINALKEPLLDFFHTGNTTLTREALFEHKTSLLRLGESPLLLASLKNALYRGLQANQYHRDFLPLAWSMKDDDLLYQVTQAALSLYIAQHDIKGLLSDTWLWSSLVQLNCDKLNKAFDQQLSKRIAESDASQYQLYSTSFAQYPDIPLPESLSACQSHSTCAPA